MELYHLNDYCSPDLPLAVWPVQKAGAIGLHRHDCFELVFITRGTGLCRINDLSYPVLRGDVYILNPHDTHCYEMASSCTFYNILFRRELLQHEPALTPLLDDWESRTDRKLYQLENDETDAEEFRFQEIIVELKKRLPGYEAAVRALFAVFLVRLLRRGNCERHIPPGHRPSASKVFEYINAHLGRTISLRELAGVAGMSTPAFAGAFRQWTGNSVPGHIGALRIRQARRLLEERKLTIGEIALRLGFYDTCHFSRVFRKKTGLSPREYRQLGHFASPR